MLGRKVINVRCINCSYKIWPKVSVSLIKKSCLFIQKKCIQARAFESNIPLIQLSRLYKDMAVGNIHSLNYKISRLCVRMCVCLRARVSACVRACVCVCGGGGVVFCILF